MAKSADPIPELVQVAMAIEEELKGLEDLSTSLSKLRLNTEKNISRAARTLQEALAHQEQLAARLSNFGETMLRMQQRQQGAITKLGASAQAIQAQFTALSQHMARFGELGKQAAEVTHKLQALPPPFGAGEGSGGSATEDLADVEQRLGALADDAKQLATEADAVDLSEVAKEATALRQRVDAARVRLQQIAKAHAARAN